MTNLLLHVRRVERVVETGLVALSEYFLEEVLGEVFEDGVEREVMQVSVVLAVVVVVIDKIFDVVVRTDVFYVLQQKCQMSNVEFVSKLFHTVRRSEECHTNTPKNSRMQQRRNNGTTSNGFFLLVTTFFTHSTFP